LVKLVYEFSKYPIYKFAKYIKIVHTVKIKEDKLPLIALHSFDTTGIATL